MVDAVYEVLVSVTEGRNKTLKQGDIQKNGRKTE